MSEVFAFAIPRYRGIVSEAFVTTTESHAETRVSYRDASLRERRGPSASVLGKQRPRHWQTWAMVGQCLGKVGAGSTNAWAMVAQCVGKVGQRLPNNRATVAQYLGNGCPMVGQGWARLSNAWAMVAHCAGQVRQRLPNNRATVAQYLGNGGPMVGQGWATVAQSSMGDGFLAMLSAAILAQAQVTHRDSGSDAQPLRDRRG